jgi:5-formyltetrahydrofolate cyclo-ligase
MLDLITRKKKLRQDLRGRLELLDERQILARSGSVHERLFATSWWREARWVFVYIAMPGEVDTGPVVTRAYREGRQVAIPRIEGEEITFYRYEGRTRELIPNQFGILEPDPLWIPVDPLGLKDGLLLVLCPGLGFDRGLHRIGRGKGYYDRFLARLRVERLPFRAVGLAFAEQLEPEVPVGPHDQLLDGLITDRELLTAEA